MKKILAASIVCCLLCGWAWPVLSQEPQRYSVVRTELKEGDVTIPMTIIVDTGTGRSWYLSAGLYWIPIPFQASFANTTHEEQIDRLGLVYEPDGKR